MPSIPVHAYRDPVRVYVETLLIEGGLAAAEPEVKAETAAALAAEAQRRIGLEVMRRLDPLSLEELRDLIENEAAEDELEAFYRVRVPDLETCVGDVLASFGEECLRTLRKLEGRIP